MEKSGLFKNQTVRKNAGRSTNQAETNAFSGNSKGTLGLKKERSIEDLMISEDDLAIDENNMLETHTLQKISLEALNWNSQFFDYSEEPYLFHMAELLSKDFSIDEKNLFYKKIKNYILHITTLFFLCRSLSALF